MTGLEAMVMAALAKEARKFGNRWAKRNATDRGEWRGGLEYEDIGNGLYHVELEPQDPGRLYSYVTKLEYRSSMSYNCDFGSVPPVFQPDAPGGDAVLKLHPLEFIFPYGSHDDAYKTGGVHVRDPANPDSDWVFVSLERVHADILLLWGLSADDANNATMQAVYRAVRFGAAIPWDNYRERAALDPDRLSGTV